MTPPPTVLERYQRIRRHAEYGFWVVVLSIQALLGTMVMRQDFDRVGRAVATWELVLWEVSSNLVIGLLVPAIVVFERRFPLHWDTLRRHLPWHLAASVAFCVLHVVLMVQLRRLGYLAMDQRYAPGGWWAILGYEYLKDVRSYAMIVVGLMSYRLLLLRMQGEASVLDTPEPAPSAADVPSPPPAPVALPTRPERFLVRKLRKEFLIAAGDIEWLQAQGNYVALHVNGHEYLLRSTLNDFLAQLDPVRFVRVHRSHAVNLDRIAEIEPQDSGDARLRMKGGGAVPCSRRYRDQLSG